MALITTQLNKVLKCSVFALALLCVFGITRAEDPSDTPSAFALFKEQAEMGDVVAQYNLGVMCETGWSVPTDNKKAVRWFSEAARQGHSAAQLRLGMLYYLGIGAAQSNIKGEKWIRKAAKQGQPLAEKINETLFTDDIPDAMSVSSAMSRVRLAYLKNENEAVSVLESVVRDARKSALRAEKEKEETTLRERRAQRVATGPVRPGFSVAAELERVESSVPAFIGDASIEENRTLARGNIATIRLQAEEGLASAQYNLGRMYELGIKVPTDKKRAMEWYEKAAEQEYADAEYRLGITFLYGAGALRDEVSGKRWLSRAAEHGHPVAKNIMDELGGGSQASSAMSLAVRWYLERAQMEDGTAAFHLGKIYQHGWGVRRDFAEAIKWYQLASKAGNKEAGTLADNLKPRLHERVLTEKGSRLDALLKKYALPDWLAHPLVIVVVMIVLLWPLFLWARNSRKKKLALLAEQNDVQEV